MKQGVIEKALQAKPMGGAGMDEETKAFGEPTWGSEALDKYRVTPAGCDAVEVLCFYQTLVDLGMQTGAAAGLTDTWIRCRSGGWGMSRQVAERPKA